MQGILIIDGSDCSGKSTLAKHICDKFPNSEYVHLGKPNKGHAWAEHKAALINAVRSKRKGKLVVIDRHFMSEAFYGQIYRSGSEYPFATRHVDRLLYRFGALRVVACPPVDYVIETHAKLAKEREEMYQDRMGEIAQLYLDLWHGVEQNHMTESAAATKGYLDQLIAMGGVSEKLGWARYDVTVDGASMDRTCDRLLSDMEGLQRALPIFYDDTDNLTGWPRKQAVLLVGDKPSGSEGEWPFMANHGSSLYLAKVLNELRADEARIAMVNINGKEGPTIVREARSIFGRIIALGKEAERKLEQARVPYNARVRHPQHASRFSHHDGSYANELREAFGGMAGVKKP
jgi:nicotinamide riboside kinase